MEAKNYLKDISDIKEMMNRSSRFISLSGLSGIMAGIYALLGAALAKYYLSYYDTIYSNYDDVTTYAISEQLVTDLILIASSVMVLATLTAIVLTTKKARKNNEKIWTSTSKRLLAGFCIPLFSGGLFCLVLVQYGVVVLVAPATLLFYGLALINASKYTVGDIKYIGLINVFLGLISTQFIGYGLYFWALGFGVLHIIYGIIMYNKYDRKSA